MKRVLVAAMLATVPALVAAEESGALTAYERFQLWNERRPIELVDEGLHDNASEIGLTEERIETLVRSRLRAARIYSADDSAAHLYVNGNVNRKAVSVRFSFKKYVMDYTSGEQDMPSCGTCKASGRMAKTPVSYFRACPNIPINSSTNTCA